MQERGGTRTLRFGNSTAVRTSSLGHYTNGPGKIATPNVLEYYSTVVQHGNTRPTVDPTQMDPEISQPPLYLSTVVLCVPVALDLTRCTVSFKMFVVMCDR